MPTTMSEKQPRHVRIDAPAKEILDQGLIPVSADGNPITRGRVRSGTLVVGASNTRGVFRGFLSGSNLIYVQWARKGDALYSRPVYSDVVKVSGITQAQHYRIGDLLGHVSDLDGIELGKTYVRGPRTQMDNLAAALRGEWDSSNERSLIEGRIYVDNVPEGFIDAALKNARKSHERLCRAIERAVQSTSGETKVRKHDHMGVKI